MVLASLDRPIESGGSSSQGPDLPGFPGGPAGGGEDSAQQRDFHRPVLVKEVLENLDLNSEGVYLDATVGEGGHSLGILNATFPNGRVVGLDRDPRSLDEAIRRLEPFGDRFIGVRENYAQMGEVCGSLGIEKVDGVLMDLGFSSRQIEQPGYGLSFQKDEPLDMRFNPGQSLTAAEIVNTYPPDELADIIYRFGEERRSRDRRPGYCSSEALTHNPGIGPGCRRFDGRRRQDEAGQRSSRHPHLSSPEDCGER